MNRRIVCALVAVIVCATANLFAAGNEPVPGVTDDRILVGYTLPMSGALGWMGSQVATLTETIFDKYNAQGGIYGRKLSLIKYDSLGMDAGQALMNYRKLILEDRVFAVLSGFAAFVRPAYPLFEENKVPWLFPWAPPEDMLFPAHKYLFNLLPTSSTQMMIQANWLIQQGKWKRLACVYADSASGTTGLEKLKGILKGSKVELVVAEAIPNDAVSAAVQVAKIGKFKPDIVFMIGMVHQPAAVIIKEIKKQELKTDMMISMNLFGPTVPKLLEGTKIDGLYCGYWAALPYSDSPSTETKQMREMRLLLLNAHPEMFNEANIAGNVENGLTVEVFIEALKIAGKDLTREKLLAALESMKNFDVGKGVPITFSSTRHEGIASGYITQLQNGKWVPVSERFDADIGR